MYDIEDYRVYEPKSVSRRFTQNKKNIQDCMPMASQGYLSAKGMKWPLGKVIGAKFEEQTY